jgi:hypothetical protein
MFGCINDKPKAQLVDSISVVAPKTTTQNIAPVVVTPSSDATIQGDSNKLTQNNITIVSSASATILLLAVCYIGWLLLKYRKALMACILGIESLAPKGTSVAWDLERSKAAKFAIKMKAKDMRIEDWLHVKVKKVDSKKSSKK